MAPKKKEAASAASVSEDYDSWSIPQLKDKLKELGGSISGSKAALVERVKALAPVAEPAPKKGGAKAKANAAQEEAPAASSSSAEPKGKAKAKSKQSAPQAANEPAPPQKKLKASQSEPTEDPTPVNISGPSQIHYEDGDYSAEYAKSNRSTCKRCKAKIEQGCLRVGKTMPSDKFDGNYTVWAHWQCLVSSGVLPRSTQLISGFSSLKPEDQEDISKKVPSTADGGDAVVSEEMKAQTSRVFEILEKLNPLSDNELKDMLEANDYPTKNLGGKTATKPQLCADGILFGACQKCEVCGGNLLLSGEGYRCKGWVNDYLKCSFKTQTPKREVWTLTPAAQKALGKMKLTTGDRLFAGELRDDDEIAASQVASQKKPLFLGMTIVVLEKGETKDKESLEEMIKSNGGSVADAVSKAADCVITHEGLAPQDDAEDEELHPEVAKAKQFNVVGLNEDFIKDSIETGELQEMAEYVIWGQVKRREIKEAQTSKFIEKMGVNMDADVGELAKTAHVLVDKKKRLVYSEMLTRTDLVSGGNSFYTLQLLQSDEPVDGQNHNYWVFRKWGRIGVSQGGTKIEEHGVKSHAAVGSFLKQYEEKTGNRWNEPFVVNPGKFVRVEMEHKALSKNAEASGSGDGGAPAEKGGGDQPLGKLCKAQIEKGDAVLDKVEALINEGGVTSEDPIKRAQVNAQFLALSAEYYTMIPHNFGAKKPPTINNSELLGAEKALLQFYLRMGFEEMGGEEESKLTPIGGVMQLPLPDTLNQAANKVCAVKDITSCVSKGTTMHKKKAGKPHQPMTPDLYGAILLYTSNAIYKQLNKALRDENRTEVERYFSYLRMLFEACARLPQQKRTLWRGVGVDLFTQYKVGSTIIWWGVSSCTSDEKVARNFMAGCGDGATFLTVETLTACDISEVSFYANEAESILLPGTQLEVVSSKKVGAKSEITLREVGRVVS